uniref:ABC-2 transporter permease n=1 Tax=Caldicellulosiruptor owensensis TaxID=55205 RepID=A0A7C5V2H5_9FIRM
MKEFKFSRVLNFNIKENLTKMNIYIKKELKEKTTQILFFPLILFIPSFTIRVIGVILLCSAMLVNDIKNKNIELLYFLPFSKKELFVYNLTFSFFVVSITSAFDKVYYNLSILEGLQVILKMLIVLVAIYGISMLFTALGHDGFVWSIVITIADALLGDLGSTNLNAPEFNPYSLISFTKQGSIILAFLYACLICFLAYIVYVKKGGE